ncbi:unnamed protein product [Ceratitis capitata]|uniref:(Mediterranean fruit fly) hypothetical protein n=1 Tax=Ceratitis capitata TaxID=7213 RepID=A0A811V9T4_CERCA|nr:unnamed protein product [Ceratitis capitata]
MFKLIVTLSALCAVASAGYLGGYGLGGHGLGYGLGYGGYSGIVAPAAYHAPLWHQHQFAPIVAAPIVKTIAPVATSYANTYKVATKAIPVVHAAPAVYAAPAYHTASTYHGSLSPYGLNYGSYGHGLLH